MEKLKRNALMLGLCTIMSFSTVIHFQGNVDSDSKSQNMEFKLNEAAAQGFRAGDYDGPLCSNDGGTVYCCKDTNADQSCAAGAKCSNCT